MARLLRAPQTPQTCHWSVLTLLMPWPYWLRAADNAWCCWNDREIVVLTSTEGCRTCPLWRHRQEMHDIADAVPPLGAVPLTDAQPDLERPTAVEP